MAYVCSVRALYSQHKHFAYVHSVRARYAYIYTQLEYNAFVFVTSSINTQITYTACVQVERKVHTYLEYKAFVHVMRSIQTQLSYTACVHVTRSTYTHSLSIKLSSSLLLAYTHLLYNMQHLAYVHSVRARYAQHIHTLFEYKAFVSVTTSIHTHLLYNVRVCCIHSTYISMAYVYRVRVCYSQHTNMAQAHSFCVQRAHTLLVAYKYSLQNSEQTQFTCSGIQRAFTALSEYTFTPQVYSARAHYSQHMHIAYSLLTYCSRIHTLFKHTAYVHRARASYVTRSTYTQLRVQRVSTLFITYTHCSSILRTFTVLSQHTFTAQVYSIRARHSQHTYADEAYTIHSTYMQQTPTAYLYSNVV